ncbi:MAG: NAD-dependent epimerase/dehydratase family protein [Bradyrhizobium sp.]|uniref:NAD-dependent epimerase/dehydratase family protein n=1 Tax=Bradyrhizobium sp. TaxID=376 RepID=UPI0025BE716B|nr:NAD-dependent epimerase/dehydratase family protein [Bradyrhizobium sp.]MBI5263820.1 NAD-dependent epimerase/dehydratase family protein [Bradyrhizobium sp.]
MKDPKPTVLVTGASGFVGRHVAPALTRGGWAVRRAVRNSSGRDDEVIIGSIGHQTDWGAALAGMDAVVHLAARVHHQHDEHAVKLYRDVNIEGTLHLARCAAIAGVRQFIFISTVLVHGRSNDGRAPFKEEDVLTPRGMYGMSKAAAEAGLRALAEQSDMQITVVRPPLVYGFGARGNFALLTRAVKHGMPLPFAAVRNHRAFLSVQNLSSFIQWRLSHPDPARKFEIFLVADEEQVSTPDFIQRLARAAGRRAQLFPMPRPMLVGLLAALGRSEANHSLLGSLELDISKARSIGWRPEVTLDEGLRMALSDPGA